MSWRQNVIDFLLFTTWVHFIKYIFGFGIALSGFSIRKMMTMKPATVSLKKMSIYNFYGVHFGTNVKEGRG